MRAAPEGESPFRYPVEIAEKHTAIIQAARAFVNAETPRNRHRLAYAVQQLDGVPAGQEPLAPEIAP